MGVTVQLYIVHHAREVQEANAEGSLSLGIHSQQAELTMKATLEIPFSFGFVEDPSPRNNATHI